MPSVNRITLCLLTAALLVAADAPAWRLTRSPVDAGKLFLLAQDRCLYSLALTAWGPNWGWTEIAHKAVEGQGLDARCTLKLGAGTATSQVTAAGNADGTIALRVALGAEATVPATLACLAITPGKDLLDGRITLVGADGQRRELALPVKRTSAIPGIAALILHSAAGEITLRFATPVTVEPEFGVLRLLIVRDAVPAGTTALAATLAFPGPAVVHASEADLQRYIETPAGASWFPLAAKGGDGPSVIGLEGWLERPAGARGGIRMQGDRFITADGKPIVFWGTNISYGLNAPKPEEADATAARLARYGINAVRMHKFTNDDWEGIGSPESALRFDAAKLARLDHFTAALKQRGIYFGWSHSFKLKLRPEDAPRLWAYDEIAKAFGGSSYALINIAPDVQDVMIEMVVKLLQHVNPETGLAYAKDPALNFVELQNEDDILWFPVEAAAAKCPTYGRKLRERFAAWLRTRYADAAAWKAAWGTAAKADDDLAVAVAVQLNPWFLGNDNLPKTTGGTRQRLLDGAAFLHAEQDAFYARFAKAIRGTGYEGPLLGSPWQAPAMLPHFLNLRSDHRVGFIDRHDYNTGVRFDMLARPGSGVFGAGGMQQVADRPFVLSEWTQLFPSLNEAGMVPVVAAYGMGLQGWDGSYQFQSEHKVAGLIPVTGGRNRWDRFCTETPTMFGQHPTVARMVLRGDVQPGAVVARRIVGEDNLRSGEFPFSETLESSGDTKSFGGTTPVEALAVGRVLVEFAERGAAPVVPDLSSMRQAGVYRSTTGQLAWSTAGGGLVTIDTAGTKGVIGHPGGTEQRLGGIGIRIASPYASLLISSLERDADLAAAKGAIISVVARQSNTGFRLFRPDDTVLANGTAPLLLEPVQAVVTLARRVAAVHILDHDGRRSGRTLPVTAGAIALDTGRDAALYYEVVFE